MFTWGCGLRTFACEKSEETQTSRVTSYLSMKLLVSLLTCVMTFKQEGESESL